MYRLLRPFCFLICVHVAVTLLHFQTAWQLSSLFTFAVKILIIDDSDPLPPQCVVAVLQHDQGAGQRRNHEEAGPGGQQADGSMSSGLTWKSL